MRIKYILRCLLFSPALLCWLLGIGNLAQAQLLSGQWQANNIVGLHSPIHTAFDNTLQLKLDFETRSFKFFEDVKLEHDFQPDNELEYEFNIRELYLKFFVPAGLEISAGRRILIWGKADEFNPADFLTAEDWRYFLLKDKGERALGNDVLQITWTGQLGGLDLVVAPFLRENILPGRLTAWRSKLQRDLQDNPTIDSSASGRPAYPLAYPQIAAKAAATFWQTDIDLIYFNGYYHEPVSELVFDPASSMLQAIEHFIRYQGIGVNLAKAISAVTLRAEAAWRNRTYLAAASDTGLIKTQLLDFVAGADWKAEKGFYVNLQYVNSFVPKYQSAIYRTRVVDFALLKLEDSFFNDRLIVSLRGGFNAWRKADWMINPQVSLVLASRYVFELGSFLMGGKETAFFGQYQNTPLAYLNLKINFDLPTAPTAQ